jgi:ribosome maturation factor RimP
LDRPAVTQRVWELAEPVALAAGLELVDVQYRPENGRVILRLLIDRPEGGVTLEALARLSRELGDVLDAHDAVPGRYHLECSSPGINRPLLKEAHFRRARGEHERVRVRTRDPIDGRRQFHGTIADVSEDAVTLDDPDAGTVRIAFSAIDKAHVDHDFSRPSRPHAHA